VHCNSEVLKEINPDCHEILKKVPGQKDMKILLKYYLRPELPVIAAGSLLDFVLKDHQFMAERNLQTDG